MDPGTSPTSGRGGLRSTFVRIRRRVGPLLAAHLGIDARALAAFRISLGFVLLLDLALRARYLADFYTDAGVMPRSTMAEIYPIAEQLSVHGQFGSVEAQAMLFAVAGLAAICVLVGYRTTLATAVSLALLLSLHGRNPLVLNGGDILLRHLTFWAILLPLAERWSVDARRRTRAPRDRIASVATAGLLLQVFVVYGVNAVLKHQSDVWIDGTATRYVFGLDQFTVLFGDALAQVQPLVTAFGRLWFWMLTLSVLLLVLRGWPRAVFAALFVGAHATMALTMQLGVFPLVSITGLLAFFPAPAWDRIERHVAGRLSPSVERLASASVSLPSVDLAPADWIEGGRTVWRTYLAPGIATLALVALVVSNVGSVTTVDMGPVEATDLTDTSPRWNMFAPNPPTSATWYVLAGTSPSGERVDAFHGGAVSYDRPPDLADTNPTARWRKYLSHVGYHGMRSELRTDLAAYLCRRGPDSAGTDLASVSITRMTEEVNLTGAGAIDRVRLLEYDCDR